MQNPFGILHWGEGNIDADPQFLGEGEHPFQLSERSPAIDAGTLDIEGYTFPEYDLLGNPRVVGLSVDLGAYEFQGLIANFIAEPVSGDVPLTVQFTDRSSGVIWAWGWNFDLDGSIDRYDSTEQNPSFTYTKPGKYSVRLVINQGEKSIIKKDFIEVKATDDYDIFDIPLITSISEPFPNPFRSRSAFKAAINEDGRVRMTVYNVRGQRVRRLIDDHKVVGIYQIVWDGTDDRGNAVASGVYNIEMRHGTKRVGTVKVSVVR
jgi:PKD repeat protein